MTNKIKPDTKTNRINYRPHWFRETSYPDYHKTLKVSLENKLFNMNNQSYNRTLTFSRYGGDGLLNSARSRERIVALGVQLNEKVKSLFLILSVLN